MISHDLTNLPGWEIISEGLADSAAGRITPAACAISIAWPRLSKTGLAGDLHGKIEDPEHVLYRLLCAEKGDAYSRYNAFLRRLISFEHALDRLNGTKLKSKKWKAEKRAPL